MSFDVGVYPRERDMYPDVIAWFQALLSSRNPRSDVQVFDTSQFSLWQFLQRIKMTECFKDYLSYEIQVDLTGVIKSKKGTYLAFVECKLAPITLRDVSQLLGYSRVAKPLTSVVLSPNGYSTSISYLIETYGRIDVLEYEKNRRIRIARWDKTRKDIDPRFTLPKGEHI
jgi:hypothetical protein